MNDLDTMLREVLDGEEGKIDSRDVSIYEQIAETFHGRQKWMAVVVWVESLCFTGLFAWFMYGFWALEETADAWRVGAWSMGVILCGMAISLLKIFYWQMMHRNTVLREVKRLELAVRLLAEKKAGE